jgi:acetoin utilization protein AcuB
MPALEDDVKGEAVDEDANLGLEFVEAPPGEGALVATVYLATVCSYLKSGGAPTLTVDCHSFPELESEVARLKAECDALLEEAARRFATAGDVAAQSRPATGEVGTAVTGKKTLEIRQELRVEDRMSREVRTLGRNDKLSLADELMKAGSFRHVVVVEKGEIVGVISQRDLFYGALAWSVGLGSAAHDKALAAVPVKQVMQGDVVTVTPETSLSEAARIMLESRVGCLPVVAAGGLVGILTEGDFLSTFTEAKVREAGSA